MFMYKKFFFSYKESPFIPFPMIFDKLIARIFSKNKEVR
ncbi:hypothetical protein B4168_2383 [Anoxybacillus flavithermus]|nr:hypothetical protein B4168_2383 [Anoxybacillus flavithermus]OAO87808.1 hypothetical protein GT23_0955 [Parageobacillus thermoglucosidasius]